MTATTVAHVVTDEGSVEHSINPAGFGVLYLGEITVQTSPRLGREGQAAYWSRVATEATKLALTFGAADSLPAADAAVTA